MSFNLFIIIRLFRQKGKIEYKGIKSMWFCIFSIASCIFDIFWKNILVFSLNLFMSCPNCLGRYNYKENKVLQVDFYNFLHFFCTFMDRLDNKWRKPEFRLYVFFMINDIIIKQPIYSLQSQKVSYHYFYPLLIDNLSSSILKMYAFFQNVPGVLKRWISFMLKHRLKEEWLKKCYH